MFAKIQIGYGILGTSATADALGGLDWGGCGTHGAVVVVPASEALCEAVEGHNVVEWEIVGRGVRARAMTVGEADVLAAVKVGV